MMVPCVSRKKQRITSLGRGNVQLVTEEDNDDELGHSTDDAYSEREQIAIDALNILSTRNPAADNDDELGDSTDDAADLHGYKDDSDFKKM
ncbi:unnamed protein product [Arabidopsis arenosa]|uniref:Uncharacterized protein n=1 Tax=Arabidopsis arenosa TaxID=38785 RepID=A0A8S1ZL54_ARAAE|nr:unnamed protein product [Arabidopsis arenosa]